MKEFALSTDSLDEIADLGRGREEGGGAEEAERKAVEQRCFRARRPRGFTGVARIGIPFCYVLVIEDGVVIDSGSVLHIGLLP